MFLRHRMLKVRVCILTEKPNQNQITRNNKTILTKPLQKNDYAISIFN